MTTSEEGQRLLFIKLLLSGALASMPANALTWAFIGTFRGPALVPTSGVEPESRGPQPRALPLS